MKILVRYMLFQILPPLILAIVMLFLCWLVWDLFDTLHDFVQDKASVGLVLEFYLAQFPRVAQTVLPFGFVIATLAVLGTLSHYREIIAMEAAGVSLMGVCWPFLVISVLLSFFLLYLNMELTPQAELHREQILQQVKGGTSKTLHFEGVAYKGPATNTIWYIQKIDAEKGTIEKAEILFLDSSGKEKELMIVEKGLYENGYWQFSNLHKIEYAKAQEEGFKPLAIESYDAVDLSDTPRQIIAALRPPDQLTMSELSFFLDHADNIAPTRVAPYSTELHYRMAYPFVCVVLCFFGLALGITPERKNAATSVFNCVFVLFALMVWLNLSVALGAGSHLSPFIAAWSGIGVFGVIGFALMARKMGWFWLIQEKLSHHQAPASEPPDSSTHS